MELVLSIDSVGFGLIGLTVGIFILRRDIHIYPQQGRYAGRLSGKRRQVYGGLWAMSGILSFIYTSLGITIMIILLIAFPFLLQKDSPGNRR